MPPLEQSHATVVLPTMVPSSMQESMKSLVTPGGGAPPSILSRLEPEVGGTVLTPFGLARVMQVRSRGVIKCQLKGSTKALCILNDTSYQVLSQVPTAAMSPVELAQYALRLQALALSESKLHHHGRALQLYERVLAVSAQLLQQQQRSSMHSSQRGDWVIRTVKCSIEAAKVAIHLHLYPSALDFTKDALGVIDALERKRTASTTAAVADGSTPPPSPARASKPATSKDEETSVSSSSDASSVTSSSSSTAGGDVQDLGCVKLFGECRVKALLLTAQSLLEMRSGKTLAYAALRLLDQAQTILRKYSTKPYLENPEFKSTMKAFVSLQKDLKRLKKQAKLIIKPKAAAPKEPSSPGRFASLFRLRRVVFADDNNSKAKSAPSPVVTAASKAVAAVVASSSSEASTWTRRDTLVLGGVVAGGLVAFHCVMRRHRV